MVVIIVIRNLGMTGLLFSNSLGSRWPYNDPRGGRGSVSASYPCTWIPRS